MKHPIYFSPSSKLRSWRNFVAAFYWVIACAFVGILAFVALHRPPNDARLAKVAQNISAKNEASMVVGDLDVTIVSGNKPRSYDGADSLRVAHKFKDASLGPPSEKISDYLVLINGGMANFDQHQPDGPSYLDVAANIDLASSAKQWIGGGELRHSFESLAAGRVLKDVCRLYSDELAEGHCRSLEALLARSVESLIIQAEGAIVVANITLARYFAFDAAYFDSIDENGSAEKSNVFNSRAAALGSAQATHAAGINPE